MRLLGRAAPALALCALLPAGFANAALYKCTGPDGTVMFQTRPCDPAAKQEPSQGPGTASKGAPPTQPPAEGAVKKTDGRVVAQDERLVAQNRAVADREAAQRRDRCASYQERIAGQRALLASATTSSTARKKASDEIAIQERRLKDDGCE